MRCHWLDGINSIYAAIYNFIYRNMIIIYTVMVNSKTEQISIQRTIYSFHIFHIIVAFNNEIVGY